ncbi:hypothetical protein BRW83_1657 [Oxalobacter formigenes]|nr:hypothetical protein BRW83_1657 [Oxalobacter formigenes]
MQDSHRDFDDLVPEVLVQVIRHVLQGLFRVIGVDDFFGSHGVQRVLLFPAFPYCPG